jgi:hypothetical protein
MMSSIALMFILQAACIAALITPAKIAMNMHTNVMTDFSTLNIAELFSSPTARYNGELISTTIKEVPVTAKPSAYEYGAVSADGAPVLVIATILTILLAAIVPGFLSAGESALNQQRGFEDSNKIGTNEFARKAREEKAKGPVVVAKTPPKTGATKAPAPTPAPKKKGPFGF